MGRTPAGLLWALLVTNALDLSTSILPSPADRSYRAPPREAWEWSLQLALLLPLAWLLWQRVPGWLRALRALPIPRNALVVCGLFLAAELTHIALRLETFPFSPVAMYSNGVTAPPPPIRTRWAYVVMDAQGRQNLMSLERESTLLSQYLYDFDYRVTAAATMYSRTRVVYDLIRRQLETQGYPAPAVIELSYDIKTGSPIRGTTKRFMFTDGANQPQPRAGQP